MPRYALIDLGSNTIRLVVYDVRQNPKKPFNDKDFKSVVNEKKVAGLSSYVQDGVFSDEGIEKAIDILEEHLNTAENLDCKHARIFATAVIRNCKNRSDVVKRLEKSLDTKIEVLSGEDEAHLGFVGATCDRDIKEGILVDIGGGSTELTRIDDGKDVANISLGQGSVSSYSDYVETVFPTSEEIERIRAAFLKRFRDLKNLNALSYPTMYGIGGSVRAVAKMNARMLGSEKTSKQLTQEDLGKIVDFLECDRPAFAHIAVKATPDRLHTLIPGCIILQTLMEAFSSKKLEICKYGVREGFLLDNLKSFDVH